MFPSIYKIGIMGSALEKHPDRIGLAEKEHRIYLAFVFGIFR